MCFLHIDGEEYLLAETFFQTTQISFHQQSNFRQYGRRLKRLKRELPYRNLQ